MGDTYLTVSNLFKKCGISPSAQNVYLCGRDKDLTSGKLVEKSGMPRPTVMAALQELKEAGLCDSRPLDGRTYIYAMRPLVYLKSYLGIKVREIDQIAEQIEEIEDLNNTPKFHQTVYSGQKGTEDAFELALRCKSRQWQIIAPRKNALFYMPKNYIAYFKKVRKEREIRSQTLWESSSKPKSIALIDVLMRKPRYVPGDISKNVPGMFICFDDKLLFAESSKNPKSILLESQQLAGTFRVLFEMAWRSSREKQ